MAKKRKKEIEEKARVEVECATKEWVEKEEHSFNRSQKYPSPQIGAEE